MARCKNRGRRAAISSAAPRGSVAVYALYDYGIRCVIAASFGDIFAGNAVQNGLLTAICRRRNSGKAHVTADDTADNASQC